jgi:5'-nucleotidase (lipoprotein e(P4) family)
VLRDLGGGFHPALWTNWESEEHANEVPLVPGAKEFLDTCRKCQVAVVYISNRTERQRAGTMAVLSKLEINVPEDQLLLNDSALSSDKTARRAKALDKFNVILHVGDNLRDFDESFKYDKASGSEGRKAIADRERSKFGTEWIILPNPAYGEWAKAGGNGLKDLGLLSPSVNLKP